jgi:hypothetical protein
MEHICTPAPAPILTVQSFFISFAIIIGISLLGLAVYIARIRYRLRYDSVEFYWEEFWGAMFELRHVIRLGKSFPQAYEPWGDNLNTMSHILYVLQNIDKMSRRGGFPNGGDYPPYTLSEVDGQETEPPPYEVVNSGRC